MPDYIPDSQDEQLSEPLNSSIQANPFEIKKQRYINESMFKAPRYVANTYTEWTPEVLNHHAEELASWVIQRWPFEI